ncbi:MAG: RNA polymerase sigma factor RpoD/SigA [Patescibacteria group bacterium]|nr:RNA polymerase sigma factor RpoD/SigA [Patescibacteria group bacterium]
MSCSIDWYLSQKANTHGLLTAEEEITLAKRKEAGDEEARRILIESNMGLVVARAARCRNCGVPLSDLVQEGNIGLIMAAENFDYRKKCRFSTYADPWIRDRIALEIRRRERIISLPDNIARQLIALDRIFDYFSQNFGRTPTFSELVAEMALDEERIEELVQYRANLIDILSLEEDCRQLVDSLGDPGSPDPCQTAIAEDNRRQIIETFSTVLTVKELFVIIKRFGLYDNIPQNLKTIGQRLKITREAVRQLEVRAIKKIREKVAFVLLDY